MYSEKWEGKSQADQNQLLCSICLMYVCCLTTTSHKMLPQCKFCFMPLFPPLFRLRRPNLIVLCSKYHFVSLSLMFQHHKKRKALTPDSITLTELALAFVFSFPLVLYISVFILLPIHSNNLYNVLCHTPPAF